MNDSFDDKRRKNDTCDKQKNFDRVDPCDSIASRTAGIRRVFDAVSPDEQPVGVNAVGRAGHKGHIILTLRDRKAVHLVGKDRFDLVHFIRKPAVQNADTERIADFHLGQARQHLGRRKPCVTGKNTVGRFSADRQRGARYMADPGAEHRVRHPVVNRKIHIDLIDHQVSHHPAPDRIEPAVVVRQLFSAQVKAEGFLRQLSIVFSRAVPDRIQRFLRRVRHLLRVPRHRVALIHFIDPAAHGGVQHSADTDN